MTCKKLLPALLILWIGGSLSAPSSVRASEDNARWVDPLVGTDGTGHTHPCASAPFGMIQAGPETGSFDWAYTAGYQYRDTLLCGFSQTRLSGTGVPDLGDLRLLPTTDPAQRACGMDKGSERAEPGYYAVRLSSGIACEMTATEHVAFHRYAYPAGEAQWLLVDFQSGLVTDRERLPERIEACDLRVESDCEIMGTIRCKGWVGRSYAFRIRFDRPFTERRVLAPDDPRERAARWVLGFAENGRPLQIKIALSRTDVRSAAANMETEVPGWDFAAVRSAAYAAWRKLLGTVEIDGSKAQKRTFYTAMYHLYLQPNMISDAGQEPLYSTFSLWDTYRAAHPLYTLLEPDRVSRFVTSLLAQDERQGYLPVWPLWGGETHCMVANHAVPVIVDACLKGIPGIDTCRAYRAVRRSLTTSHPKSDWALYDRYGYYPCNLLPREAVSRTLESTYDDYCAALLAARMGDRKAEAHFLRRSSYWRNLFDPATGLMRGRDSAGQWRTPFDPLRIGHRPDTDAGDYTEGNAWQYTWHVQHDVPGLVAAMGGEEPFAARLDSLFTIDTDARHGFVADVTGHIGQYAHGNEPSHHVAYLYSWTNRPWRGQELIRQIVDTRYNDRPDGLCGNEDCGQMSAWYLFACMGFYPVDPCGGSYVFGAPQIGAMTLHLKNGNTLRIRAKGLSARNRYVARITLNGEPVTGREITHAQLMQGGELVYTMTDRPCDYRSDTEQYADVIVYGGTSAAVTAAVEVARSGKSVIVVSPDRHLGGMSSGGLGYTDSGNTAAIGGLSREFYHRIWRYYNRPGAWNRQPRSAFGNRGQQTAAILDADSTMWVFEPHAAEQIFEELISEHRVRVFRDEWLDREHGVATDRGTIRSIRTLSGKRFAGKVFIDATYEGDLMAAAGVGYRIGRESAATYGECWNGVQTGICHHRHHFRLLPKPIDPYLVPGDPASGLLPRIAATPPGEKGAGDRKIQAYCYRMCLTDLPENRVPFTRPEGYDASQYELLLRIFDAGWREWWQNVDHLPNRKSDTNNHGPFSTDNIGMNYRYPDAGYAERRAILREHETYQKGLLWFVCHDPRVPAEIRERANRWGLAADEFRDNGHWPHQIYIREARRMAGAYVMTEHDLLGQRSAPNPVGMGSYPMDSHNVQRYVAPDGSVQNEGDIGIETPGYGIAYGAITPRREECTNLLVPVCASCSHIAYGSIRMEPVFMILGQSAAVAACHAIDEGVAVQEVDYPALRTALEARGQRLHARIGCDNPRLAKAYELAVETVDENIRGSILAAGADYGGEWTRDISINAWNGVSMLRPATAERSLWSVTVGRDTVGHQYWDRALWIVAAANHYRLTGDRTFLAEAYRCGVNTLRGLEKQAFDPATGLFTGASVFNDGISGYPVEVYDPTVISSYVLDHPNAWRIKTLSTNSLYCGAYRALSEMAQALGLNAAAFDDQAERLRENILRHFRDPATGRLAYLIDHTGKRHDYQEALGISFAVLFGVVTGDAARELIGQAVVSPHGIPTICPDFANFSPEHPGRHNNLVWPMAMGFYARAARATDNRERFLHELRALTHLALDKDKGNGDFREIYNPRTGQPDGGYQMLNPATPDMHWRSCSKQVWSATAYLSMVYDGLLGIRPEADAIRFEPFLPEGVGRLRVNDLNYRGVRFDIEVRGRGATIASIRLDGERLAQPRIAAERFAEQTYRMIEIELEP